MNPLAHGPAARRRCRRRTAFLAPATLTLVVIALVTALSLLWVLDDPPPGAAFPDDYCLPTTMQECGCTTGATPPTGQATDDDEVLADEQLDYREEEFTHNGTTSTYRVFDSGIDRSRPVGVVIRLHGDGAYEYLGPGTLDSCLAAVAAAHNMVLVHPLTPSEDLTWWTTLTPNVGWLQALYHEQIAPLERVDADQVWWMGYSGGRGADHLRVAAACGRGRHRRGDHGRRWRGAGHDAGDHGAEGGDRGPPTALGDRDPRHRR